MIEGFVKKIMFTGIEKYSKIYGLTDLEVQIKVTKNSNGNLIYKMCKKYVEEQEVTFLQIMDKKFDFGGFEAISTPFLKKSLINCAEENGLLVEQVCCYIVKYIDNKGIEQVGLSFYKNPSMDIPKSEEFKHSEKIKNITLSKHLEKIGL
jgi:hypothetical protein